MQTTTTGDTHAAASPAATSQPASAIDERVVDVRGLRCSYGSFEAVCGVDLLAGRGELLAVLGTNGAGKTTVMDTLEGRRRADSGRVEVLGLDPLRHRRALARRVGVMLQTDALPDELTPTEFLRLWHRIAGAGQLVHHPVPDLLARVELTGRQHVRIGRLSGGERRRLELATALSADPELLFLDEPTAGLDPRSQAHTWKLLRELLETGTTIVLTTHHLAEAEALADRIAIMHDGVVAVAGAIDDVVGDQPATNPTPTLADIFHDVGARSEEPSS